MRTKTLFLAAAALAASLATSSAQSNVYSVNIVGYYNINLAAGVKTLVANQLDNGTNTMNDVLAALPNKSSAQYFNGTSFVTVGKSGGTWTGNPAVPPGAGFFVVANSACTNVFLGSAPTSNSLSLTTSKVLVAARIPFSGNANDAGANSLNLAAIPNKSSMQIFNGTSFITIGKAGGSWTGNPAIAVGQPY